MLDIRPSFKPQIKHFNLQQMVVMTDFICMYVYNIPDAEVPDKEENRRLSYELTKVLVATNMTIGC